MEPQKDMRSMEQSEMSNLSNNEVDIIDLIKALWRGKWLIIASTVIFALGSILFALSQPNIYQADALLAPTETSNGGGLSKMAGQFGGLAALAGVNLSGGDSSQTELAVQVMKSRQFIKGFIEKHEILIPLMATKGWDISNNKLVYDENIFDINSKEWLRSPSGLRGVIPSDQEAYEVFLTKNLNVKHDKETGLYTVSVKHYSPYIAQQWVNWLVEDINKVMRERTLRESSKNLAYLNNQLKKTSLTDMQSTFFKLIEEQTKSLMLAEAQDEFVFKTIDSAVVPEVKIAPNRAMICIIGTLIGAFLSSILILLYHAYRTENS
ncbi:TPA: LPS O-antigen length regulator [Vibrio parahaemolyticus]|uniref:Polysaccharide chain length determinant N-terminal domain-containing protein n=3 Tax=Vibrio parahaemolyticus TaxID=670 RepID=A0A7M1W615_VIBPH|nr:LPS O-antigen length regulator [Vibrio parahaemolyticus]QOS22425.1 hypothetical protein VP287_00009 [Vibrio parahaemolyticus]HCM0821264.1 LPS O-antigen length regulator [Vibrio parahaemolyticus]